MTDDTTEVVVIAAVGVGAVGLLAAAVYAFTRNDEETSTAFYEDSPDSVVLGALKEYPDFEDPSFGKRARMSSLTPSPSDMAKSHTSKIDKAERNDIAEIAFEQAMQAVTNGCPVQDAADLARQTDPYTCHGYESRGQLYRRAFVDGMKVAVGDESDD